LKVVLVRNPWPHTVPDDALMMFLTTAATYAQQEIKHLIGEHKLAADRDSFAAVLLDPSNRVNYHYHLVSEIVLAIILIGPAAEKLIPNAAAKADAHNRHSRSNGEFVREANFCLADGEFAWGYSAEFRGAGGAGSGLKDTQDQDVAYQILRYVMSRVHRMREQFIRHHRAEHGSWGWYSSVNTPDPEYADVTELLHAPGVLIAPTAE
jgi:hypothetical protein